MRGARGSICGFSVPLLFPAFVTMYIRLFTFSSHIACRYLTSRYDAVVAQVPLMAVHAAGRVSSVDPDLWTPPPLRHGASGWNPEWGKVWQWWGVPRYTL